MDPEVTRLRDLCLALSGTSEKEAWGDPTFRVRDRIYAMAKRGDGRLSIWCAAVPEARDHLIAADPAAFFRPPYVGGRGWVGMRLDGDTVDWAAAAELLRRAHALIAEKADLKGSGRGRRR